MLTPHPQRVALHNEVHARPFEQLTAPLMLSHLALLTPPGDAAREHLNSLLRSRHLPLPAEGASYLSIDLGGLHLRWEKHTEFQTYTFWRAERDSPESFGHPAVHDLPADWLAGLPGEWLVGLHLLVTAVDEPSGEALARALLDPSSLVGSSVSDAQAQVYTDFRLDAEGYARQVVRAGAINPRRLGRTVQRLLEVETYRMVALLGLPVARNVAATLHDAERDLAVVAADIQSAAQAEEPELLRQLTQLAGGVESLYANTHARLSASSAYFELVQRRIGELRETRHASLQMLGEFMERRLGPAMQTCAWAARRQQALSERIARISTLLRTRVEIEQQQTSQGLLDAMNKRQETQLRLQNAVEGLSIAVVTYYCASLFAYLVKGAKASGLPVAPDLAVALSIPLIAGAVWWGVRRLHRRAGLGAL